MACLAKRRGRWIIDFYDQAGKRRWITLPGETTKAKAREELRSVEDTVAKGIYLPVKKIPSFAEVKKLWLEYKRQFLRETSWETAEANCRNHFEKLDALKINQINTATIETFITHLQNTGKTVTRRKKVKKGEPETVRKTIRLEKNIALGTVRKVIVTLNQIMAYAVRHRLIDFNPVTSAERPRRQGREGEEKSIAILSPEQIRSFMDNVPDQKYRVLFLTAIMTGARQGEVLGLKWTDLDFTKKQISINRTFNMGRFFTPKTKGSVRRIDLAPMAVKALAEWKLASGGQADANHEKQITELEEKEKALVQSIEGAGAGAVSPSLHLEIAEVRTELKRLRRISLVFPNEAGEPMNYSNMVQRYFRKALKDAGIPQIRFHDVRHTYASLLLAQGENIKYIQTQLGHSSPTVTLNVYAHLMKSENQEAACRLENSIFSVTGSRMVATNEKGTTA